MTSKHEAYEWALFGACLWSADARDGVQPTDFQSGAVQSLARELFGIYDQTIKPEAAHRIREWLRASRINVDSENRSSVALKKVVQQLSAQAQARVLADRIQQGLARDAAGLPSRDQTELRELAERLFTILDAGDGPPGVRPLD